MAETTDKKKSSRRLKAEGVVQVETGPVEIEVEEVEGFTPEEVARLIMARQAVANGRYTDVTNEHRKLLFVQWLIEHNKLNS